MECCNKSPQRRSQVLRDPFSVLELIGITDEIDQTAIPALTVPSLLSALRRAREKQARAPRVELATSSSWARYMQRVATLAREGKGDPFAAYGKRLQDPALCRNSRQSLRSALIRYAELDLKPRKRLSGFSHADHMATMAEVTADWVRRLA